MAQAADVRVVDAQEQAVRLDLLDRRRDLLALAKVGDAELARLLGPARLGAEGHLGAVVGDAQNLAGDKLVDREAWFPVLDKVVEKLLDHDAGDDVATQGDEESGRGDGAHEAAHRLPLREAGEGRDLGVHDLLGARDARLARRQVDGARGRVDPKDRAEHVVVDPEGAGARGVGQVIGLVARVHAPADVLADPEHGARGRLADHAAGHDVADLQVVEGARSRRDARRDLLRRGALVGDDEKARLLVLRDHDELVELLPRLERLAELIDTHAPVVGEVGKREQRRKLRGHEGDHNLLGVDLGDDAMHGRADLELLGRHGCRERLAHRRDELVRLGVDVGDPHVDGLADVEDVGKVGDEALRRLGLGHERAQPAKQVHNTPLVEELGHDGGRNLAGADVVKVLRGGQVGLDEALLEGEHDTVAGRLERPHARLDARPGLEALLGVLEADVGVVEGPDDAVDTALDVDEEALVAQPLDRALEHLADLQLAHGHEHLREDARLEREEQDAVERRVPDHACAVVRPRLELDRAVGERGEALVRKVGDVAEALDAIVGARDDTPVGDDARDLDARERLADWNRLLERDLGRGERRREVEDVRENREGEAALAGCHRVVQHARLELLADLEARIDLVLAQTQVGEVDRPVVESAELDVEARGHDGGDEGADERARQQRADVGHLGEA